MEHRRYELREKWVVLNRTGEPQFVCIFLSASEDITETNLEENVHIMHMNSLVRWHFNSIFIQNICLS